MKFNRLTLLEAAVLAALTRRPHYGREIATAVRAMTAGGAELSEKSLYTTLNRMIDKELIARGQAEGRRRLRYYKLTPFGAQAFRQTQALMALLVAIPPVKDHRGTVVWRQPKYGGHESLRQVAPEDEEAD